MTGYNQLPRDWRYLSVHLVDAAFHALFPRRELWGLCNLERSMYWRRIAVRTTCGLCHRDYLDNTGSTVCCDCLAAELGRVMV